MRSNRLIAILFVTLTFSPVTPAAGGNLSSFNVLSADADPQTGSATMGVPIQVPQGRGGIQPSVALSYNSSLPNGIAGMGWALELGSIQRASKGGIPRYDTSDQFIMKQSGSVSELVEIGGNQFRPAIEGGFQRIEFIGGAYWRVTDKSGTQYFFGETAQARLDDNGNTARTFKWMLERVEDVHGNIMAIHYLKSGNQVYPDTIQYTSHTDGTLPHAEVKCLYENRDDPVITYQSGFNITTDLRLKAVESRILSPSDLFNRYEFTYEISPRTGRSVLVSVTKYGDDGVSSLPAVSFSYQSDNNFSSTVVFNQNTAGDNKWNRRVDNGFDFGHENVGPLAPPDMHYGADWGPVEKVDAINFQGKKDSAYWHWTFVYVSTPTYLRLNHFNPGESNAGIFLNGVYQGDDEFWLSPGWSRIDITNYNTNSDYWYNVSTNPFSIADIQNSEQIVNGQTVGDFDGDAFADLLIYDSDTGEVKVSRSIGNTFVPPEQWFANVGASRALFPGDYNHDGRTDVLSFNKSSGNWRVFTSDGTQFIDSGSDWLTGFGINKEAGVGDFNGDGITDVYYVDTVGTDLKATFALGNGSGFDILSGAQPVISKSGMRPSAVDINSDGLSDFISINASNNGNWNIKLNTGNLFADFLQYSDISAFGANRAPVISDFNMDGYVDVGYFEYTDGSIHYRAFEPGQDQEFRSENVFPVTMSLANTSTILLFSDFNGDGVPDMMSNDQAGNIELAYSNGLVPDLMASIDNGIGATTYIAYSSSTRYSNPLLPFPVPVIDTMSVTNNIGESYTTRYSYSNGLWDAEDREFRGFGLVRVTDPDGNYSETQYHQDDTFKGRPQNVKTFDAQNNLYQDSKSFWEIIEDLYPGVDFIYLSKSESCVYDGNETKRCTAEEYFYDDVPQYGSPTKVVQWGEVDPDGAVYDIEEDTRTVLTTYVNNSSAWILGLPSIVTVQDHQGNEVRRSTLAYDGLNHGSAPIKGLLTRKTEWAGDRPVDVDPVTQYAYDNYGNLKSTVDPRTHSTIIHYDPQYHLFPVSTVNAMGHTVTSEYFGVNGVPYVDAEGYHGLWGQMKSTTDPNEQQGKRHYDTFGRLVKTVAPMDSFDMPTQEIVYQMQSPVSTVTTKERIKNAQTATIDQFAYYDGLGRVIQSKRRAADAGQYILTGRTTYNSRGLPEKKYVPEFSATSAFDEDELDPAQPYTLIEYDAMGRAVKTTNPDGTFSNMVYDDWQTRSFNENGHRQDSVYDAYGRLVMKIEFAGADGRADQYVNYPTGVYPARPFTEYAVTSYIYDSEGNLTNTIDHFGNTTTISYDRLGRKVAMDDPDMGVWSYEYDPNGNLVKQIDAKGQTIQFEYDPLNRLKRKFNDADLDVAYTYDNDAISPGTAKGRLTTAEYGDALDHAEFAYDAMGREIRSVKMLNNIPYEVNRDYDALNRLVSVKYPMDKEVFYQYNAAGQMIAVGNNSSLMPPDPDTSSEPPDPVLTMAAAFAHYKLNDNTSGSAVTDFGSGSNSATASAATSSMSVTGKIQSAFSFQGAEYVSLQSLVEDIKYDSVGSIAFWVKREANQALIPMSFGGPEDSSVRLQINSDGSLTLHVRNHEPGIFDYAIQADWQGTDAVVPAGEWHHYALVQDGTLPVLYVDGVNIGGPDVIVQGGTPGGWLGYVTSTGPLADAGDITNGAMGVFYNRGFHTAAYFGALDDVRYYRRVLTDAEIQALYNNGAGTETEEPIL